MMRITAKAILTMALMTAGAVNAATCLETLKTNPSSGNVFVDEIYYGAMDSGSETWVETFALETVKILEKRLGGESCEATNLQASDFICKRGETEVCVASVKEGLSVAVVKDYVDNANVVLLDSTETALPFPSFKAQFDKADLWIPNPSDCYEGLLNNSYNSSAHVVNMRDKKRWSDGRFVLAGALRRTVKNLSLDVESCSYVQTEVKATDLNCRDFGHGVEACLLNKTSAGFFEIFKVKGSDNVSIVFNRWD